MSIKKSDEYTLVVNTPELACAAEKKGYKHILMHGFEPFTAAELEELKTTDRLLAFLFCNTEGTKDPLREMRKQLEKADIPHWQLDLINGRICFAGITSPETAYMYFPEVEEVESILVNDGMIKEIDYTDRCGNCHARMQPEDKYCKICGTKRGEGTFLPYDNPTYILYGPLVNIRRKCESCGYIWQDTIVGADQAEFCPQCGKKDIKVLNRKHLI